MPYAKRRGRTFLDNLHEAGPGGLLDRDGSFNTDSGSRLRERMERKTRDLGM